MLLPWIITIVTVIPATLGHRNRVQDDEMLVISDSTDSLDLEDFEFADKLTRGNICSFRWNSIICNSRGTVWKTHSGGSGK